MMTTQLMPVELPQPGTVLLNRYRVERQLGRGGMGVVLAVRHIDLDKLFAIKLLRPSALTFPDARERFLREARAAARLTSEHAARVMDVGTLKKTGLPYMVMEYLEGRDLRAVLDEKECLSCTDAALYVYQACQAVVEAHTQNIVHRDLKPANLFVTRRADNTLCIKVLDFGISKTLDAANQLDGGLTKTGVLMGSPKYMSPEQMMDHRAVDKRSDIWALGVILYECVTGGAPFDGEALTEIAVRVCHSPAIVPSLVRPGIPAEFEAIVLRCLEKDPNRRYGTVTELMTALLPFTPRRIAEGPVELSVEACIKLPETSDESPTVMVQKRSDTPPSAGTKQDNKSTIPPDAEVDRRSSISGPVSGPVVERHQHTSGAWGNTNRSELAHSDPSHSGGKNGRFVTGTLGVLALLGCVGVGIWQMTATNPSVQPASAVGLATADSMLTAPAPPQTSKSAETTQSMPAPPQVVVPSGDVPPTAAPQASADKPPLEVPNPPAPSPPRGNTTARPNANVHAAESEPVFVSERVTQENPPPPVAVTTPVEQEKPPSPPPAETAPPPPPPPTKKPTVKGIDE